MVLRSIVILRYSLHLIIPTILTLCFVIEAYGLSLPQMIAVSVTQQELQILEPGRTNERELRGGESHFYQIDLISGQYLHLIVEQKGIDVVVTIFGPDGKKLGEVDSPNGTQGPEPVYLIAETTGSYRFEVRSLEKDAPVGRYESRIAELRQATAMDKDRIASQKAFAEGELMRAQGTEETLKKAIIKFDEALMLKRAIGDRSGEGYTLINIGSIYNSLGEYEKALDYYGQALQVESTIGDRDGEATTLSSIGVVYFLVGEMQKALDYYNQALALCRSLGNRRVETDALHGIGFVYKSLGEYQKALDYYGQALQVEREIGYRNGEATTLSNIGEVYRVFGEHEKALDYFNLALILKRAVGERIGEAITLNNIGRGIYSDLGDNKKALEYLHQALLIGKSIGDRRVIGSILSNIGRVYSDMGENQKALDYLNQALVNERERHDREAEAITLTNIGFINGLFGEYQKAIDYCNQALLIGREIYNPSVEAYTLYRMASIYRDSGDLANARRTIEDALNIIESLRLKIGSQELRTSYLAKVQQYYEMYIELLMRLHELNASAGYDAIAIEASERGRARSLLELLSESHIDIRQGVDAKLLEREQNLQQKLNAKEQDRIKLLGSDHSKEAEELNKEIKTILTEYEKVQVEIRQKSPRYASLTQPRPLSLREIQSQLLDPNTLLLEYSLGTERSHLWLVTATSISSFELPKRAEIEKATDRFYARLSTYRQAGSVYSSEEKQLRERQQSEFVKAATALSQMILGPIAEKLGNKRLLIVADGVLYYLPFAALTISPDGKPLIVDHEIVYLPSASALAVQRRELAGRKSPSKSVVVFADPVFNQNDERITMAKRRSKEEKDEELVLSANLRERSILNSRSGIVLERLPFTRKEAASIKSLGGADSKIVLDFDASLQTATNLNLSQYRIIHFATHGLLNSSHPELSAIVLSLFDQQGERQPGLLTTNEVYNLSNLSADLVVLSACQTGLGKSIKGEGIVGLTRGFMYAGAARVMVSLWNVNDKATSELMARFYKKILNEKKRPAEALRDAQIEMWKQQQWQSPYYWAGFVIQGEPR